MLETRTQAPTCSRPSRSRREDDSWLENLPAEWRDAVPPPLEFRRYEDYEMPSSRTVGYDADGKPCYTAHRFSLIEPRSDDGEEFYSVLAYGEELAAWRLNDERWLIYRVIHADEDCRAARGFYSFSDTMPR